MAKKKDRPAPGTEPFTTGFLREHLDERFINGGRLFDQWLAEQKAATVRALAESVREHFDVAGWLDKFADRADGRAT